MKKSFSQLKWSLHCYGLPVTALSLLGRVTGKLGWHINDRQWLIDRKEQALDRRFNISTGGKVLPSELGFDGDRAQHAVEYYPTSRLEFSMLLEQLSTDRDLRQFTFIDFGSGKGRVILMASEFPFRRCIGVELSPMLHEAAVRNIETFRSPRQSCLDVESNLGDATSFKFPVEPLVVFFFNPFDDTVLSPVLHNLQMSWGQQPRDIICIYHNPVHRKLFDESEFWREEPQYFGDDDQWFVYASANSSTESVSAAVAECEGPHAVG